MAAAKRTALKARVEAYFSACDATCERFEQKNAAVGYRQLPYTLSGLAHATGLDAGEILAAGAGRGRAERALLSDAVRRIARYLEERALLGELQGGMAMALLKELGRMRDAQPEEDARRLTVVLSDREGWSE